MLDMIMEDPCDTILYHITFEGYGISEPIILNREIPTFQVAQGVYRTGVGHLLVRSGVIKKHAVTLPIDGIQQNGRENCVIDHRWFRYVGTTIFWD